MSSRRKFETRGQLWLCPEMSLLYLPFSVNESGMVRTMVFGRDLDFAVGSLSATYAEEAAWLELRCYRRVGE